MRESDVVILGAGVGGLAAASALGRHAVVLEREDRPGGLVRTHRFGEYWFDHVLHLLYFPDDETDARVRAMLGADLAPCPPEAWVETAAGTVRFPFQMHLGGLEPEAIDRCVEGLEKAHAELDPDRPPSSFEDLLRRSFGEGMCELFLLPYNRKMWKRPLDELATSRFTWNITPPDRDKVLEGARRPDRDFRAYNSRGWYPRPREGAPVRGMEVLSRALARRAHDLRLKHSVRRLDLERREVVVEHEGRESTVAWREACLATLPLPALVAVCPQAPDDLRRACRSLQRNRVLSGCLSIRGPRPEGQGHWRYYADESLCFTRLTFMHEFDPLSAPPSGWGLLVEVTERAEDPLADREAVLQRMKDDVVRAGALPPGCEIVDEHLLVVDPAYVVFTPESLDVVEAAQAFLRAGGVEPLGRYGRWEYSSMAQVMRDAFTWADAVRSRLRPSRRRHADTGHAAVGATS